MLQQTEPNDRNGAITFIWMTLLWREHSPSLNVPFLERHLIASRIAYGQKPKDMPYEERCALLHWNTLKHRREYLSTVEWYMTLFWFNGLNFYDSFENCKSKITPANQIQRKPQRVNCLKYSFFVRIIKQWNDLPNHLLIKDITNNFKKNLKKHVNIYQRTFN